MNTTMCDFCPIGRYDPRNLECLNCVKGIRLRVSEEMKGVEQLDGGSVDKDAIPFSRLPRAVQMPTDDSLGS